MKQANFVSFIQCYYPTNVISAFEEQFQAYAKQSTGGAVVNKGAVQIDNREYARLENSMSTLASLVSLPSISNPALLCVFQSSSQIDR